MRSSRSQRARWLAEERTVAEELTDGAMIVEVPYAGTEWLLREVLGGAGELVVLEPEEARAAIAEALEADAGALVKAA